MCAVKESELDTDSLLKSFLNIGAFGSAAVIIVKHLKYYLIIY